MGKISVGTFHSWLKQHRPYVGIYPSQSDYYDKCKEYNEEVARARQIANRLKQSGHSTEESIREQEQAIVHYTALLQQHKEEAQAGLEYYKRLVSEAESIYRHICTLQQLELTPERSAELKKLQMDYSVFISADYNNSLRINYITYQSNTRGTLNKMSLSTQLLPFFSWLRVV